MTPVKRMPKIISELSTEEITFLLRKWNLSLAGRKAEKLVRLKSYLENLQITNIENYDFELDLTDAGVTPSSSSTDMNIILEQMQDFMERMERRFEEFRLQNIRTAIPTVSQNSNISIPSGVQNLSNDELTHYKSLTLPPFWTQNPELWFLTAEQKFQNFNITSDNIKYSKVIESLEVSTINKISSLIRNPPEQNKYTMLKSELISLYEETQESKFNRIFNDLELGDQKPSQLFQEMKNLACNKISDDILFSVWIKKLPKDCEQNLRGLSKISPLHKLLDVADGMLECPKSNILSIKKEESCFEELGKKLDKLIDVVSNNTRSSRAQYRSASRNRQRSSSNQTFCYYHRRFKEKANKCVPPCTFNQNSGNTQPQH